MTNPLNVNPDTIFNGSDNYIYSHKQFFDMVYLRKPFTDTLKMVISYYRENVIYLPSTNILASILFNIPLAFYLDDRKYVELINSRIPSLCQSLNLTSSFNYGKIFNKEFYSESEILLLDTTDFDIRKVKDDWENIVSVNPLLHPWGNMSFTLPIGGDLDSGEGISVIAINIALLATQFRLFLKEKMLHNDPINSTVPIFIAQYVLPNMMAHQTDIAIFNIIYNNYYGLENSKSLIYQPYSLPVHNYMNKVNVFSEKVIKWLDNRGIFYTQLLQSIPAVFKDNMEQVMRMPDVANTRQVWWALVVARLRVLVFIINLGGIESIRYNKSFLSEYQKDLAYLESEHIYNRMFTTDIVKKIQDDINYVRNV